MRVLDLTSGPLAAIDVEGIRREHPRLVVLPVTPFGRTGSHAGWQATSPVFHALSGELSRSGVSGRERRARQLAPRHLESLRLGYDILKDVNPEVIVVDSSAFGSTGPWSRRGGYGPLVRASAGMTA